MLVLWKTADGKKRERWRVRIRSSKHRTADGKPYTFDKLYETRLEAETAHDEQKKFINGGGVKALLSEIKNKANTPCVGALLEQYAAVITPTKSATSQTPELARLTRTIPKTVLNWGSLDAKREVSAAHDIALGIKHVESDGKYLIIFGALLVSSVKSDTIEHYIAARREKGILDASIRRELNLISDAFRHLKKLYPDRLSYIENIKNPLDGMVKSDKPKKPSRRIRRISDSELKNILEWMETRHQMRAIFHLAVASTMRRGEMLGLKWEQVDFESHTAHLPNTKNGEERYVPLTSGAIESLKKWQEETGQKTGQVFSYKPQGVRAAWKRLCAKKDIQNLHFHDLRKEGISRLVESGINAAAAAAIAGASDLRHFEKEHYKKHEAGRIARKINSGAELTADELTKTSGHKTREAFTIYSQPNTQRLAQGLAEKRQDGVFSYGIVIDHSDDIAIAHSHDFGLTMTATTEREAIELLIAEMRQAMAEGEAPNPSNPLELAKLFAGKKIKQVRV